MKKIIFIFLIYLIFIPLLNGKSQENEPKGTVRLQLTNKTCRGCYYHIRLVAEDFDRVTQSNDSGFLVFENLPFGTYEIRIFDEGWKRLADVLDKGKIELTPGASNKFLVIKLTENNTFVISQISDQPFNRGTLAEPENTKIFRAGKFTDGKILLDLADSNQVAVLEPGDILVNDKGAGFLRRVDSIDFGDTSITINTKEATFYDTFQDLWLNVEKKIELDEIDLLENGFIRVENSPVRYYKLFFEEVKDDDGNILKYDGQIFLSKENQFQLKCDIGNYKLDYFLFHLDLIESFDFQIQADSTFNFGKEIEVVTLDNLPSFVVSIPTLTISVPLVVKPRVRLFVGVDGKINSQTMLSLNQAGKYVLHGEIKNDQDISYIDFNESDFSGSSANFFGNCEIQAYGGIGVDFLIYNILGPYAEGKTGLNLVVNTEEEPVCGLFGSSEIIGGAKLEIFGRNVVKSSIFGNLTNEKEIFTIVGKSEPTPVPNCNSLIAKPEPPPPPPPKKPHHSELESIIYECASVNELGEVNPYIAGKIVNWKEDEKYKGEYYIELISDGGNFRKTRMTENNGNFCLQDLERKIYKLKIYPILNDKPLQEPICQMGISLAPPGPPFYHRVIYLPECSLNEN